MPRDAQRPQFFRTLRVKDVNQVGVLASVLGVIARHGGNVGDIRTVSQGRTTVVRDLDMLVESLSDLDRVLAELEAMPESTVLEVRDEVLSAHAGGKIRMVSKLPIDTFAELGRVYTPGVGEVCRRIHEAPQMAELYTTISNTVAIVSDGSAVMGLGNLGPVASMPVLEGKAALLARLVGVSAVPIALRTQDPDEIVAAVRSMSPTFGVIQLEDIASPRCFDIEARAQDAVDVAVFHDDQHGTAAVMLAVLLNACGLTGLELARLRIGQIGLGAAGLAISRAVMHYTGQPVLGADKAADAVERLARSGGTASDLEEICGKCDVVIATTGQPGLIKPEMVRPGQIIFALSNPRPEIDAAVALEAGAKIAEDGAAINNLLCYPGVCRGFLDVGARRSTQEVFRSASEAIVAATPKGQLLPNPLERKVHAAVARRVAKACQDEGLATRELDSDYFQDE